MNIRKVRFLAPKLGWLALLVASSGLALACAGSPSAPVRAQGQAAPVARATNGGGGMIWPRALEPGDTIQFVAPAGPLDRERMARAKTRLEERGYRVVQREDLFAEEGYLAGDDDRRVGELMDAFRDSDVDAIFPGTGGYGTMRILDRLDYAAIRANPKLLVGFSDLTALHAAINQRAGVITFHSPNPMWGLGGENGMTPFSSRWFFRAVEGDGVFGSRRGYLVDSPGEMPLSSFGSGRARGRLVGGNLSLVSALEGTPYAIDARDAILVIEDVREAPYRVDRMLRQLELAGKLDLLRGAIIGQFTRNYDREDEQRTEDPRYTVDGVIAQYFATRGIPVLVNFALGHHEMNATLPLGGLVEIDATAKTLRVLEGRPLPWLASNP